MFYVEFSPHYMGNLLKYSSNVQLYYGISEVIIRWRSADAAPRMLSIMRLPNTEHIAYINHPGTTTKPFFYDIQYSSVHSKKQTHTVNLTHTSMPARYAIVSLSAISKVCSPEINVSNTHTIKTSNESRIMMLINALPRPLCIRSDSHVWYPRNITNPQSAAS